MTDMLWFKDLWSRLDGLQHPKLIMNHKSAEYRDSYFRTIMPAVISIGREHYSCRDVFHPGRTCEAYVVDKLLRCIPSCAKITFIASLLPQIFKKRNHLINFKNPRKLLRTLKTILVRYIKATMFLVLGTWIPFITVCAIPLKYLPFPWLPFGVRIALTYMPIACGSIIVDIPTKMPSYMGFFVSKAISMIWSLLKDYKYMPEILFEKQIGMALLAALIGLISVLR